MAAFEGGLIAALTMAFGIAPGRRFVPRSVDYKPLALARIEPVLDVSDVCPDGSDEDDTSALIERETRLIAALPDMTGHDLSGLMKAVAASGCRKRDDVVEFLGSLGVLRYADACWLESVYRNCGRALYAEPPKPAPTKLASTRAFVKWWRAKPEPGREVSQAELLKLYAEYCEHENLVPLSGRQLVNKIKQHGVESFRKPARIVDGKQHRPTAYKLKRRAS